MALLAVPSVQGAQITDPTICIATATTVTRPGVVNPELLAPIDDSTDSSYLGIIAGNLRVDILDSIPASSTIVLDDSPLPPVTAAQGFLKYSTQNTVDYCLYSFTTTPQTATGTRSNFQALVEPPEACTDLTDLDCLRQTIEDKNETRFCDAYTYNPATGGYIFTTLFGLTQNIQPDDYLTDLIASRCGLPNP